MAKYLVVAHQTVTNPLLLEKLRHLHQEDPAAEFTLLVPATLIHHLIFFKGGHEEATAVAGELAEKAKKKFQEESLPLTETRVGSENPREAIDSELTAHPDYAGIVISTLSPGTFPLATAGFTQTRRKQVPAAGLSCDRSGRSGK